MKDDYFFISFDIYYKTIFYKCFKKSEIVNLQTKNCKVNVG